MDPIIYASFAIGIGLFLYSFFDFLKQNKVKDIGNLFTWDIIVFILAVIIYFLLIKNLINYTFWDEYSHWGVFAKEINFYKGLPPPKAPVAIVAASQTRLVVIFQYSIAKLIGFKEAYNVFAHVLMCIIFSSVVLITKRLFWSLILLLIVILPTLYVSIGSWNSLHQDTTVGIIFSAVIALYIQSKKYNNLLLSFILIIPTIFILPNIKEVGYWLSYFVIFFVIGDQILEKNFKNLKISFILMFLPITSKVLWFYYNKNLGVMKGEWFANPIFMQIPFSSVVNLVRMNPEELDIIKIMFWKSLSYFYSATMLYIYLIIGITIVFLRTYGPILLKDFLKKLSLLFMGLGLYIIFRFELYITSFMQIEKINIYSYDRYLISYTAVFAFCAISFIKILIEKENLTLLNTKIFAFLSFILAIISVYEFKKVLRFPNADPHYFYERRNWINGLIKDGLNENRQFKENNFNMLDCYIYRYLEAPTVKQSNVRKCLEHISPEHAEVYIEKIE
ncbi:MAG TPA: hypothetical protein LFW21_04960 [Rickettsia endosymbiont of Pyrocoelia pectoralis]|nr:hypothetical protein [Rickettsia endosymbiont of Pyrocoelia pectoralis]